MISSNAARRGEPAWLRARVRLHAVLDQWAQVFTGVLLVGMLVFVLLQVFTRYVLSNPLPWTEEAARFSLVWLTFLAAALVMGRRQHIAIDTLAKAFGAKTEKVFTIFATTTVVLASAALVWGGISLAVATASLRSPASGIPISFVYGAAIIGFALIFTHGLLGIINDLSSVRRESLDTFSESLTEESN